ncbi:arsenic resistance N-acetyltransferase ArsN2 [Lysobacter olei]
MDRLIQPLAFGHEAVALLAACGLPTSDLVDSPEVRLFGHRAGQTLTGIVGLELLGEDALLRSLAVAPQERGTGLGAALVSFAEKQASERGARSIYLLTTTARAFFERLGYACATRGEAPPAMAATRQFAGVCPSSATFMVKRLTLLRPARGEPSG